MSPSTRIEQVPTNIITGALGVGKTTLIKSLLDNKPSNERWAVLVNEFGEVGIDGALFSGATPDQQVFIKEVPGGCMCCTSGLPMQIALNMLLAQAKPHRLLIEPTGLGHPKEVMHTLTEPHYHDVLNIQSTLTLLDARKLRDEKWRNHATFQEQCEIADCIVLTKQDLYEDNYEADISDYFAEIGIFEPKIVEATKDQIDIELLNHPTQYRQACSHEHGHEHDHKHSTQSNIGQTNTALLAPKKGFVRVDNAGEGFVSRGWLCASDMVFDYREWKQLIQDYDGERLKAVLITNQGVVAFNLIEGEFSEQILAQAEDSRIELITQSEEHAAHYASLIDSLLSS